MNDQKEKTDCGEMCIRDRGCTAAAPRKTTWCSQSCGSSSGRLRRRCGLPDLRGSGRFDGCLQGLGEIWRVPAGLRGDLAGVSAAEVLCGPSLHTILICIVLEG